MPPKNNNAANPVAADETLQAVLVADSFNLNYRPLTLSLPRCLLPIANTPMIEYAIESLAASGVLEIFIVCCSHSEKIKEYINQSKWAKSTVPLVKTIVSQSLQSIGDALRDIDAKQLIKSDFILMSGDVISNVDLGPIVVDHRARRLSDKNSIMTLLLMEASVNHPTRSKLEESMFVLDAKTKECLQYEPFPRYPSNARLQINPEIFKNHAEILVRNDLIDCQIDICSVEVPALFTENFDYQDIRKDFVTGVLESELLGKTLYVHLLEKGYAAQCSTLQMYKAISNDILMHFVHPLSPDNFSHDNSTHAFTMHNIYKGTNLSVDRTALLKENVVIGAGTAVGRHTQISNSVIGPNCDIGDNVLIHGSYIMESTIIKSGCRIENSFIGADVTVLANVHVRSGCLVESEVVLGPDVTLPDRMKVSISPMAVEDDFNTDDEATDTDSVGQRVFDTDRLGAQSNGFIFTHEDSDLDSDYDERNLERGCLDYEDPSQYSEADDDEETDEEGHDGNGSESESYNDWETEVAQTLQRAFTDNHTTDIAVLELNTLKMAMNITFKELRQVVIPSILSNVTLPASGAAVNKFLNNWSQVLLKFTHTYEDQLDCMEQITQHLLTNSALIPHTTIILKVFYDINLVEEEPLLEWFEGLSAMGDTKAIRLAAEPVIKWLKEAETDSDSESDSD